MKNIKYLSGIYDGTMKSAFKLFFILFFAGSISSSYSAYRAIQESDVDHLALWEPSNERRPSIEAIDLLKKRPELATKFRELYGYVPAPREKLEILVKSPELRFIFLKLYGYQPLSQKAIDYLTNPISYIFGSLIPALVLSIFVTFWIIRKFKSKLNKQIVLNRL